MFVLPRVSSFNAIPGFMWCGVGNNTFICKSFNLQVSSFLVTFERTATFSQLSHDGRTAVERDKNARKIVANSPWPWQWHDTGQNGDKNVFRYLTILTTGTRHGRKRISDDIRLIYTYVYRSILSFPPSSLASTLGIKNQVGLTLQVSPSRHLVGGRHNHTSKKRSK